MQPIEDLAQFQALAQSLPEYDFAASGIVHPRISLFAATRAVADVPMMQARVAHVQNDPNFTAAVARADADLRLYELDLANPSTALGEKSAALTIAYGMTAIEPGPDLFALAALGDDALEIEMRGPMEALATLCSRDICALLGALLAARMAGLPVIVDGSAALIALRLLHMLNEKAISHCAVPQGSGIEEAALRLGVKTIRCKDPRPFYALADTIVHSKNLMPV